MGAMDSVERRLSHALDALLVAADCVLDLHHACDAPRDRAAFDAALRALIDARGLLEELAWMTAKAFPSGTVIEAADAEATRLTTRTPLGGSL